MILKELNHRRLRALEAAKSIANRAESARRGLTAQETQTFDAHFAEAEQLRFLIDQEKRLRSVEDELNKSIQQSPTRSNLLPHELPEYLAAFRALLTGGISSLTPQQQRSLNATSDTGGGFLLAPAQMAASLVAVVNNTCFVRRMSTVYPLTSAVGINAATLANDVTDPEWTAEVNLVAEDTGLSFGSRELRPHPMSKAVKVSNKLMRSSGLPADVIVTDRLAYKCRVVEEKAFLTGNGSQRPLGVFVASPQGINTDRDVVIGGTGVSDLMTFDPFLDAKFSLKAQYWPGMQWILHRDILKPLTKLKDGSGNYIYRASDDPAKPDTLLGRPINLSEYAPNTFTAGSYLAVLGDFSHYIIADCLDIQIKILSELYIRDNLTAIIAHRETDGMPALSEAFARVRL